jgi:hypothetical protein
MIAWAEHVVPCLASIEVALDEAADDMPPGTIFWTHRDDTGPDNDSTQQNWIELMAATFPPEVCQNFVLPAVSREWTVHRCSRLAKSSLMWKATSCVHLTIFAQGTCARHFKLFEGLY